MYVKEISAFVNFLSQSRRTLDEICSYLIVVSFKIYAPRAIYVGEVTTDGFISMRSSFGFDPSYIGQWARIPLNVNIPITEAIANDRCILVPSRKDFLARFPEVKSLGTIDDDWKTCIAVPINSHGVYFLVLHSTPNMDGELEQFLRSIGSLILLHLREVGHKPFINITTAHEMKKLSERQELIKNLLSRGFTNPEIALKIGYSESLVRQETIAIYAHLGISGRRELIENIEATPQ